jgi:hypothetical protein
LLGVAHLAGNDLAELMLRELLHPQGNHSYCLRDGIEIVFKT